jgi:hypothetical protein
MGNVVYRPLDEIETMSTTLRLWWSIVASTAMTVGASAFAACSPEGADGAKTQSSAAHDAQRDFDYNLGTWRTHVKRLPHPFERNDATTLRHDAPGVL